VIANVLGAASAVLFAQASIRFYLHTHRLIGAAFFVQQLWVATAFLARRPTRSFSTRRSDWILAFGGTFLGALLRPAGAHPVWGVRVGLAVQILGLVLWALSFVALGRSFGMVPADRGLVVREPYAVVRHPLYAAYMLAQLGYLLQSVSKWNVLIVILTWTCQIGRAIAEERFLGGTAVYRAYRVRVRWRLVPGLW
jgi:protein-S-isoprenylcysteine O-methyltransferase Ste14